MVPKPEEIKREMIIDQLAWNESINADNVEVYVENGTVELRGTVQNMAAKIAAERETYQVPGINHVKNHLAIEFPPGKKVPNDKQIEQHIQHMLDWNDEVMASHVQVTCDNHVVTLTGMAESYREKHLCANLASSARGVIEVVNELSVKPPRTIKDMSIGREIRNAFNRTYLINEENISVKVKNGTVHLKGNVPSFFTKIQAHQIASFTSGVRDVVDEITIG